MAEWSKALDSKSSRPQKGLVGSNPTPSAIRLGPSGLAHGRRAFGTPATSTPRFPALPMVIEPILKRRAAREYENAAISDSQLEDIIRAGQFAPTAHHNASVEFIVIRNPKTKDALFTLLDQEFVHDAPVLIAPVLDRTKSVAPVQDLSVATENMFLQAASMGLGTVWKNVSEEESEKVKKLLGIPSQYLLINLIPVGHPKGKTVPHSDAEFSAKKIHREKF